MHGSDGDDHMHQGDGGGFFPPPSKPRKVAGGIRPQGPVGRSWWARRWLAALEAMGLGDRLARGRSYAKDGQVLTLDIELGHVTASVQGTRVAPYAARIQLEPIDQLQWLAAARSLAGQARFRAQLLSGEVPEDIEAVFARLNLRLFPSAEDDLQTTCTCSDWASPCKHVAAACYLVGEALDRDPFLLFRLRGIERGMLMALLENEGRSLPEESPAAGQAEPSVDRGVVSHVDLASFWNGSPDPDGSSTPLAMEPPPVDAPLIRLLGAPPLWTGTDDFEDAMRVIHARIASDPAVVAFVLGDDPP